MDYRRLLTLDQPAYNAKSVPSAEYASLPGKASVRPFRHNRAHQASHAPPREHDSPEPALRPDAAPAPSHPSCDLRNPGEGRNSVAGGVSHAPSIACPHRFRGSAPRGRADKSHGRPLRMRRGGTARAHTVSSSALFARPRSLGFGRARASAARPATWDVRRVCRSGARSYHRGPAHGRPAASFCGWAVMPPGRCSSSSVSKRVASWGRRGRQDRSASLTFVRGHYGMWRRGAYMDLSRLQPALAAPCRSKTTLKPGKWSRADFA